ncbi:unnamed protein product [Absidia cylindrospora]
MYSLPSHDGDFLDPESAPSSKSSDESCPLQSWLDANGVRQRSSNKVIRCIDEEQDHFFPTLFGGARDFQDNNDLSLDLKDDKCGLFSVMAPESSTPRQVVGKATEDTKSFKVNQYQCDDMDANDNSLVSSTDIWHDKDCVKLVGILDMATTTDDRRNIVN